MLLLPLLLVLPSVFSRSLPLRSLPSDSPSVNTPIGNFIGTSTSSIETFRGIPFAQPPVGDLRFAPPAPLSGDNLGNYDATAFKDSCFQMNAFNGASPSVLEVLPTEARAMIGKLFSPTSESQSEDCLYLNIQRPAGLAADAKLPVMVWIFGGAFLVGSPRAYDGTSLIERSVNLSTPIIFVSLAYRINSFGFLPGKEMAADPTTSINAGLLDQRLALEWVADFISYFGGDPAKVTLFGQSSGAISASYQMLAKDGDLSYKGQNLFRAAIMESGAPASVTGAEGGQHSFDVIAAATNCTYADDPIACLRAVPYKDLAAATNLLPNVFSYNSRSLAFLPRTDGTFLTDEAHVLLAEGRYNKDVAVISGNQYDEGTIYGLGTFNITTHDQLNCWLKNVWFPRSSYHEREQILRYYPEDPSQGSPYDTGYFNIRTAENKRINSLIGDIVFHSVRRSFLSTIQSTQPTWSYVSRVFSTVPFLGSFHATDVLSVFGKIPTAPTREIQTRWIALANTLNPGAVGFRNWPKYGYGKTLLQFKETGSTIIKDDFRQAGTDYLNSIAADLAK